MTKPLLSLTPDLIEGFMLSFIHKDLDEAVKTPQCHREWWMMFCSKARMVAIAAPRSHAKAQSLDSNILTPSGWRRLGSIRAGDKIFAGDGSVTTVTGMSPITEMDLWRVTTRDGRSTLCNMDHLWDVVIPSNTEDRVVTKPLSEIYKIYQGKREGERRVFIPTIGPAQFPAAQLPIDPYTLGAWLGDGSKEGGTIYSGDPEILSYIPYGYYKRNQPFAYRVVGLTHLLAEIDVRMNKHIPGMYLTASVEQRLALLQGLMDTDGSVHQDGEIAYFSNTNEALVQGVVDLVRSLGGIANVCQTTTSCNGKTFLYWSVSVKLGLNPFRLKRKAEAYTGSIRYGRSAITFIELERRGPGRCIMVAHPEHTYITDDYLKTHNTTAVTKIATLAAICFRFYRHVLIVSDTEQQARDFLGDIKAQIMDNDELRGYFHIAETVKDAETEFVFKFKDGSWCRLIAKGAGQKLRGLNYRNARPDLVMVDDLENDELVENKARREKLNSWFMSALLPAMATKGKIRVVGTVLHFDGILEKLMKDNSWYTRKYKAHNDDFSEILWPERFSKEYWIKTQKSYYANNTPDLYSREYLNEPISRNDAYFQPSWWRNRIERKPIGKMRYYIGGDLAVALGQRNDYSVFIVGGVDSTGTMFIVDVIRRRMDSLDIVEELFRLNRLYSPELVIMERGQISHSIEPVIIKEEMRRGIFIPRPSPLPVPVHDKAHRAKPVQAKLRLGELVFDLEADWWPNLEDELIKFLRSAHDDQVDALAWLCVYENYLEHGMTEEEARLQELVDDGTLGLPGGIEAGRNPISGY